MFLRLGSGLDSSADIKLGGERDGFFLLFLTVVFELSSMLAEEWDPFIKDSQGGIYAFGIL